MNKDACVARLRRDFTPVPEGKKLTISPFQPSDAVGVSNLYLAIYGDAFPMEYVYDPEAVIAANQGPGLFQVVARTAENEVVGIFSLFYSSPNTRIMESGGLMILPHYRGGTLALRIIKFMFEDIVPKLPLQGLYGQSVVNHLMTQKLARKMKHPAVGLELLALPARSDHVEDGASLRTSLISEMLIYEDEPHAVHLPERYAGILGRIYGEMGLTRDIAASDSAAPPSGESQASTMDLEHASISKFMVEEIGENFGQALEAFEKSRQNSQIFHLHLPLSDPGTPFAVEAARERGYFFGGLLPLWTGRDVLFLQKLDLEPEKEMQLLTDLTRDIVAFALADRAEVMGVDAERAEGSSHE